MSFFNPNLFQQILSEIQLQVWAFACIFSLANHPLSATS